jgi:hypothetical protein
MIRVVWDSMYSGGGNEGESLSDNGAHLGFGDYIDSSDISYGGMGRGGVFGRGGEYGWGRFGECIWYK